MNDKVDRAEAALRAGKTAEARALLEAALAGEMSPGLRAEATSMLGLSLLSSGEKVAAIRFLQRAVELEPDEGMFRYNYARGLEQSGQLEEATVQHREAVRLSNGQLPLVIALVQVLARSGRYAEGAQWLDPIACKPDAPAAVRRLYAKCLQGAGDLHAALDSAKSLLPEHIEQASAQERADALMVAHLLQGAMNYDEAAALAQALVERDPGDAEAAAILAPLALWMNGPEAAYGVIMRALDSGKAAPELLVQLLGYNDEVEPAHLDKAERLAADEAVSPRLRGELLLALAQYDDRRGDFERAWARAQQGNAIGGEQQKRDWRGALATQIDLYHRVAQVEPRGDEIAQFYLCGAPRSGQSLIQSVVAAAPQVASVGERGALLAHLLWRGDELERMPTEQCVALFAQLAEADKRGLRRLVGNPALAVDKNPSNLVVAGSIARIHPQAKFAVSLRDPADVAVSIYMRGFSPAYDYARDLGAIVDHLEFLADSVAAWRAEGLAVHAMDYHSFVAEPEIEGAGLFTWLGIEWDKAYLDPASRRTPVPTFSAAQVRKPIGQHSSRGSEPYLKHLAACAGPLDSIREKQAALLAQSC